jgi:hypothetical protein
LLDLPLVDEARALDSDSLLAAFDAAAGAALAATGTAVIAMAEAARAMDLNIVVLPGFLRRGAAGRSTNGSTGTNQRRAHRKV